MNGKDTADLNVLDGARFVRYSLHSVVRISRGGRAPDERNGADSFTRVIFGRRIRFRNVPFLRRACVTNAPTTYKRNGADDRKLFRRSRRNARACLCYVGSRNSPRRFSGPYAIPETKQNQNETDKKKTRARAERYRAGTDETEIRTIFENVDELTTATVLFTPYFFALPLSDGFLAYGHGNYYVDVLFSFIDSSLVGSVEVFC